VERWLPLALAGTHTLEVGQHDLSIEPVLVVGTRVLDDRVGDGVLVRVAEVLPASGTGLRIGHVAIQPRLQGSLYGFRRVYPGGLDEDAVMDDVSIAVEAPPERVWALVTDVTQMGRWSPECHRCEWLDDAHTATVGARFRGHNKRGLLRWSSLATVVAADEPEHFAFEVHPSGMRWGYRIEPQGAGARVTEYRQKVRETPWWNRLVYAVGLMGRDPDGTIRTGMAETLARLKAAAEAT